MRPRWRWLLYRVALAAWFRFSWRPWLTLSGWAARGFDLGEGHEAGPLEPF
jgi:hypothetical protein